MLIFRGKEPPGTTLTVLEWDAELRIRWSRRRGMRDDIGAKRGFGKDVY